MTITSKHYVYEKGGWAPALPLNPERCSLVLVFGSASNLAEVQLSKVLDKAFPQAIIAGCSTAGQISGRTVYADSLAMTAITFEKTRLKTATLTVEDSNRSELAGQELAARLVEPDLRHVFVLSEGLKINGSSLVRGLLSNLPKGVTATGGLAADGSRFENTVVLANASLSSGLVTGIGFYGTELEVGYGSLGGWDSFGPERIVTKAEAQTLYQLDDQSALDIYKSYLGKYAKDLPASALLFPLSLKIDSNSEPIVRTILSINEEKHAMNFAGDIPLGATARFMKANFDRLVDGASDAANVATFDSSRPAQLAILISCVGRRLVLKQRTEDEVEAAAEILGPKATLCGFYSYGEIAPFMRGARCELHNQTMTITTFSEN